jgi:hypothetical protein
MLRTTPAAIEMLPDGDAQADGEAEPDPTASER